MDIVQMFTLLLSLVSTSWHLFACVAYKCSLSCSMIINVWWEGITHLWQRRVGTIRKGNVTWCVLSPLPVAWADICIGALALGSGSVGLHLLWLLSACQLHLMTSENSQTGAASHMKSSGHSQQTVSQPLRNLEALTWLLNWAVRHGSPALRVELRMYNMHSFIIFSRHLV